MPKAEQTLRDFGLNPMQASTYLAALRLGETKATAIAKEAHLKRTSVYENLRYLTDQGLLRTVERQGVTYYAPEPPTKLIELLQNREKRVQDALPYLMEMFSSSLPETPRVQHHEGWAGLIAVYEDVLTAKDKNYCYFASFKDEVDLLDKKYVQDFTKRRIKLGINHRGLRDFESKAGGKAWGEFFNEQGPAFLREYRYMPPSIKLPVRIYMYDNKVALMSMRQESWGLVIYSAELYKALMSMFDFIWNQSQEAK